METKTAATLQKKKINKGKLKKTIKNVLCRPDPVFWPAVNDEQRQLVDSTLSKFKVVIPEFKKPLWKDLKNIPKDKRPKPPKVEKPEGLLFGITECVNTIQKNQCSGIIIETTINPRTLVQPLLESCIDKKIPAICVEGLRKISKINFGIPTSCLGIKEECLVEISKVIHELGSGKLPKKREIAKIENIAMTEIDKQRLDGTKEFTKFEYLLRTNKKMRVFVPPSEEKIKQEVKLFKGQDFIEFSDKSDQQSNKSFKKMKVKRISNNPNRVKVK